MSQFSKADITCIDTIRTLAADVVFKSNSGHPGAPMGMAAAAHVLFTRYAQPILVDLKHVPPNLPHPHNRFVNANPKDSHWLNRDRFVLSNGCARNSPAMMSLKFHLHPQCFVPQPCVRSLHILLPSDPLIPRSRCALQYILLHLLGYKLRIDDLKAFRQIDSITPGHPEYHHTDGVEVTTGPLGQGFANAVGLAIAEAHLGATYNRESFPVVKNFTYVFCGDGCLMEGVASEAASIAGHQQLGSLIVVSFIAIHLSRDFSYCC